jgi:hypothetical protein
MNYYDINNLNFYNLSLYQIQSINYNYFELIEKYLSKNLICKVILKNNFKKYKQNFYYGSGSEIIYLIINDFFESKLDLCGCIFSIDGEYENVELIIFQNIFNDLNIFLKKVLLIKKLKLLFKLIIILIKLNKKSRNKIKKRLSFF